MFRDPYFNSHLPANSHFYYRKKGAKGGKIADTLARSSLVNRAY